MLFIQLASNLVSRKTFVKKRNSCEPRTPTIAVLGRFHLNHHVSMKKIENEFFHLENSELFQFTITKAWYRFYRETANMWMVNIGSAKPNLKWSFVVRWNSFLLINDAINRHNCLKSSQIHVWCGTTGEYINHPSFIYI